MSCRNSGLSRRGRQDRICRPELRTNENPCSKSSWHDYATPTCKLDFQYSKAAPEKARFGCHPALTLAMGAMHKGNSEALTAKYYDFLLHNISSPCRYRSTRYLASSRRYYRGKSSRNGVLNRDYGLTSASILHDLVAIRHRKKA